MRIRLARSCDLSANDVTPEPLFESRRAWIRRFVAGSIAGSFTPLAAGEDDPTVLKPKIKGMATAQEKWPEFQGIVPAKRNEKYVVEADRPLTDEAVAASYNNFYEFSEQKEEVKELVDGYQPWPWKLEVTGLCHKPETFDLDDLVKKLPIEERIYRFRCVEAWAMVVPWTGFPLKALIDRVEPKAEAKYVRFVSVERKEQMPGQKRMTWYPWPYYEALTLAEATNELTMLAVGIYGHLLPKQHGAPVRLVVPWKYGLKNIKSVVKIEFTSERPKTFWNDLVADEYSFDSNVDPTVDHPRWSQATERMIGTGARRKTLPFNGYGDQVAGLYAKK